MKKAGYIAIVGRPNVGKSTLLNFILGRKLSITSRKPQTTRHRILGVKTISNTQFVYVDTPGIHQDTPRAINRVMNKAALNTLYDVDVVLLMIDAQRITAEDKFILERCNQIDAPVLLLLNKIDKLKDRAELLPLIDELNKNYQFKAIVPISAKNGEQLPALEAKIAEYLPESEFFFPPEQVTDRSDHFIVAEFIREKIMRLLGQELPYAATVTLDLFQEEKNLIHVAAVIWLEKTSQKAIVIGKQGERLKKIGTQARLDLEKHFKKKLFLQLWVKVKSGWSDDKQALKTFGVDE